MKFKLSTILTLLAFTVNVSFGQNSIEEVAKKSCECIEKDTSNSIESKVQNCVSGIYTKSPLMNAKESFDFQKLRQILYDIKVQVYSECEYVILKQKEEREKIYKPTESSAATDEYRKGNEFLNKDSYEKALPFFKKAIELDTNFVQALDHTALCYRRTGDFKNAELYYKKSLQVEPKGQTAIQNLAIVYSSQNQPQKALEQYQKLITLDMSNAEGYFGIARLLLENNTNLDKALDLTNSAIKIYQVTKDPNLKDGFLMKGLIYFFSNDKKNAKKYLEEAKSKGAEIPTEIAKKLKIK